MALVTNTVLTEIKGLLNDPSGSIYPDQALIPLLQKSYRELQVKLNALGISTSKEVIGTTVLLVGTKILGDGAGLPTDLIYPIELGERLMGSENKFAPMEEREWDMDATPGNELGVWVWREETLHFIGANTDRQIMIRYVKSLPALADVTSPVLINDSQTWLAQRTAAIASLLLGHNPSRAEALITDLYGFNGPWEDLKATKVKRLQNIPVRRRRTRWRIP
jgi:hypothetical protein